MENGKKLKVNFCLGEITLKELVAFLVIVASLTTDNLLNYYQTKSLPQLVKANADKIATGENLNIEMQKDIVGIKGSVKNINQLIDTINKKQDIILNRLLK